MFASSNSQFLKNEDILNWLRIASPLLVIGLKIWRHPLNQSDAKNKTHRESVTCFPVL